MDKVLIYCKGTCRILARCSDSSAEVHLGVKRTSVHSTELWKIVANDDDRSFVITTGDGLAIAISANSAKLVLKELAYAAEWIATAEGKIHVKGSSDVYLCASETTGDVEVRSFHGGHGFTYTWDIPGLSLINGEDVIDYVEPKYGYPGPSFLTPTALDVMGDVFAVSDKDWLSLSKSGNFDYIVIGSSFCCLGFIQQALANNPFAKILILEYGNYFFPQHFQNMPIPFKKTLGGIAETFPWSVTEKMHNGEYIKWQHGQNPFLGGRSMLWSAWCPEPLDSEMDGWPCAVKESIHRYFERAAELLQVIPASEIRTDEALKGVTENRPIYGPMQEKLQIVLGQTTPNVETVTRVIPAPLAVHAPLLKNIDFQKYSVTGPLLSLLTKQQNRSACGQGWPLKLATNCIVQNIKHEAGKAVTLVTSKGEVTVNRAKIILAMGAIPPTTLVLNSFPKEQFPDLAGVGTRYTAHFITAITARIRKDKLSYGNKIGYFEIGAMYIAGKEPSSGAQYHIQLSAVTSCHPARDVADAFRHMPDVVAAPSYLQIVSSPDHVVFVCATLGEMDQKNADNWIRLNGGPDPTCNIDLQAVANEQDNKLWDDMDKATFDVLEKGLGGTEVEYWHPSPHDDDMGKWLSSRPQTDKIRVPGLVHEASMMWIGGEEDKRAPVGLDYRLRGVENVFVTGASLWPTGASWNPTCSMVALAMHLADTLEPKKAS